ncbi:MAG: HAD hydrolase-like protein, partial [Achromobacter sp.]
LFDDYECGTDLFGKAAKIDRLMRRHEVAPERFLLVGDEMRDIDAARKAGVQVGSVAWGYNHVDALRERGPDEIFLAVDDLPAILA